MNWMDFGLGYFLGALSVALLIVAICGVVAAIDTAWSKLTTRIKKLEDAARESSGEEGTP